MIDKQNLKILIINDDPVDAMRIRGYLKELGFVWGNLKIILEKNSAIDFLKSEDNEIDLLIIDSKMLYDDLEITEAAGKMSTPPKIIICLHDETSEIINSCRELIFAFGYSAEYLGTPIDFKSLEKAIALLFYKK